MRIDDLLRPAVLLGAAGAAAALGLAGYVMVRDPALARRLATAAARGLGRAQLALAETVEEAIDLWEDVRAQARREIEHARFQAAEAKARPKAAGDTPAAARRRPAARRKSGNPAAKQAEPSHARNLQDG